MTNSCEIMVVSGPNGSGKTTLAEDYAAHFGWRYLGADKIAGELNPDDPTSTRIAASRRFSFEVATALEQRQHVVVESTLSGRTFVKTLNDARDAGYFVSLVHLFLDSADTCCERVAERVLKGGHDVPEGDIRRRFSRCAANFWQLYRPLSDKWLLMYNATANAQVVAEGDATTHTTRDGELFTSFMQIVQSYA